MVSKKILSLSPKRIIIIITIIKRLDTKKCYFEWKGFGPLKYMILSTILEFMCIQKKNHQEGSLFRHLIVFGKISFSSTRWEDNLIKKKGQIVIVSS